MENNKLIPISIIILTVGVMLSSIWLGYSIQKATSIKAPNNTVEANVFNMAQVASYLGMTEEEVQGIIIAEKKMLESTGSYSGLMFPYFKVNNNMYFYKEQVDEWLKEVSSQRKEYDTVNGFAF